MSCSPASTSSSAGADGDPDAPVSGRVFKIERTPAASASRTPACSPARSAPRQRVARRWGTRTRRRPRSGSSRRPVHRDATSSSRARWRRSVASARSGSATRSASHRRGDGGDRPLPAARARGRRLRRDARAAGLAPGGAGPARRAGPAHRRPPGRAPPRDRRLAVRRGPEGGHPGDARARLRHRGRLPRDDRRSASSARRGSARPRRSSAPRRRRTSPGRSSPLSTNPFLATLALRIEPAPFGSGIEFRVDVEPRLVPLYLFKTVEAFATQMEAYVREALDRGPGRLAGDRLPGHDDRLRLRRRRSPRPADFRRLTQLVLTTALERAGTWVCEPLADLTLEMPTSTAPGRPGGARAARRSRHRPVLGERAVDDRRRAAGRARPRPPAPAPRPVDGGGDPRDPPRRLPADRQRPAAPRSDRRRARSTATPGWRRCRSAGSGRYCSRLRPQRERRPPWPILSSTSRSTRPTRSS